MRAIVLRLIGAVVLIAIAYAIRAPLLQRDIWNLDEGSTFTMGQQVLEGDILYRDAADNRAPLVPYLKAIVFALFGGWNAYAVHVALALGLGVCAVLLWQLGRLMGAERAGIAASVVFSAVAFVLLGRADTMAAHTEWFLLFFSLVGYLIFAARAPAAGGFGAGLLAGGAFGLAALCKQPGLLDLGVTWILCGLLAWENPAQRKRLARFVLGECTGVAALLLLTLGYFAYHEALEDLVFYAWTYNTKYYVPEVPFLQRLAGIRVPLTLTWDHARVVGIAGILAGVGMVAHIFRSLARRQPSQSLFGWLVLGWTATGLASTMLSGRDFSHYAIQFMPGLSLACGWLVDQLITLARRSRRAPLVLQALTILMAAGALVWLGKDVQTRRHSLVPEDDPMKLVGAMIQEHVAPSERIFVWGYVPEVYYFSRRLPSSRFIYTNYVTGLVPWTNLDPLIDTNYASVPGSWSALEDDLKKKPPALVVDTGTTRGYAKYLLGNQTRLWKDVYSHCAEIETSAVASLGLRLFRRERAVVSAPLPANLPSTESKLVSRIMPQGNKDLTVLTVTAPAGITRVDLYRDGRLYRSVDYPSQRPCDVSFWVDHGNQASLVEFQAVLTTAAGPRVSPTCRTGIFGPPADLAAGELNAGPCLTYGERRLGTLAAEGDGRTIEPAAAESRWNGSVPARFTYARARGMTAVVLNAGALISPTPHDGPVRVTLSFVSSGGKTDQLQERFLNIGPKPSAPTEELQTLRGVLPGADPGDIVVEFFKSGPTDGNYPPIFVQSIRGEGPGPDLVLAPDLILVPEEGNSAYGGMLSSLDGQNWGAHAPTVVVYPSPSQLRAVTIGFGLRDGAHVDEKGGRRTDGVEAIVAFQPQGAEETVIFRRMLDPYNRPEDRGPQTERVELPIAPLGGKLRITLTTGPRNDPSYDWSYLTRFTGEVAP